MGVHLDAVWNDTCGYGSKFSSRDGVKVDTLLLHGGAITSYSGLKRTIEGERGVSANGVLGGGMRARCVPKGQRAWTSGASGDGGRGAAWDKRSITLEIAQKSSSPWAFAQEDEDSAVAIGIAMRKDGMLPVIDRRPGRAPVGVIGHRELRVWYSASYPTECPAGWTTADLDRIAARILAGDGRPAPTGPDIKRFVATGVI